MAAISSDTNTVMTRHQDEHRQLFEWLDEDPWTSSESPNQQAGLLLDGCYLDLISADSERQSPEAPPSVDSANHDSNDSTEVYSHWMRTDQLFEELAEVETASGGWNSDRQTKSAETEKHAPASAASISTVARRVRRGRPPLPLTVEERDQRKRMQNARAASRYRQRKRLARR